MVTDEILRDAALEAERFLVSALLAGDVRPHKFSEGFEKKINKLIRRARNPVRYRVLRSAAAVLLAVMTLFGALFAISPEVRASVIGWFKSISQEFIQYSRDGANTKTQYDYYISNIPDGYRELSMIDDTDYKTYLYVNDDGDFLQFSYAYGAENGSLFIDVEGYERYSGHVHGVPADIYIAAGENENSTIVWQDPDSGVLFSIFARADQTTLIEIAESVQKKI